MFYYSFDTSSLMVSIHGYLTILWKLNKSLKRKKEYGKHFWNILKKIQRYQLTMLWRYVHVHTCTCTCTYMYMYMYIYMYVQMSKCVCTERDYNVYLYFVIQKTLSDLQHNGSSFNINHLCIYRWAEFASTVDHNFILTPLVWQRFFALYLQRPFLDHRFILCIILMCMYMYMYISISQYSNSNYLSSTVSIVQWLLSHYCCVQLTSTPIAVKSQNYGYCWTTCTRTCTCILEMSNYCTVWWRFIDIHVYCTCSYQHFNYTRH